MKYAAELRQAARVTIGAAIAYATYRLLGFQQGYWAVFTVILVIQGSIGGTLGAATDRLVGTIAGALLGGLALFLAPPTPLGIGIALAAVILTTGFAAALRPALRVAPVTAAILLLAHIPGVSPERFVVDRVLEIALGGVIGVATSLLVFPARSRALVVTRAAGVLARLKELLCALADDLDRGATLSVAPDFAALRKALSAVETAMTDAERERSSRLAEHSLPEALPRTLWRVRNDVVQLARVLDGTLPASLDALNHAAAALLRAEAELAAACASALEAGQKVDRGGAADAFAAFETVFSEVRAAGLIRVLDFEGAGRVFGLVYTLDRLRRDLNDFADRVDEVALPRRRGPFARR